MYHIAHLLPRGDSLRRHAPGGRRTPRDVGPVRVGRDIDAEDRRIIRICTVCDLHSHINAHMHCFVYDICTHSYVDSGSISTRTGQTYRVALCGGTTTRWLSDEARVWPPCTNRIPGGVGIKLDRLSTASSPTAHVVINQVALRVRDLM